jgi:beta-glucosidase
MLNARLSEPVLGYITGMKALPLPTAKALAAIMAILLSGCSYDQQAATPPAPLLAAPTPRTAMSDLRAEGNLGAHHQRIVDEAKKGGCEICFIGDSITQGWEGAGKERWTAVWAPRHAVNCGIGGDRTQHVIGRLDHGLLDALAAPNNSIKWVVLMIGTNNTGSDSAEDIAAGIHTIIHKLRARLPHAQIALFAVFPRGHLPSPQRDTINSINARLAALAAHDPQHIHLIDIGPKFLTPTGELPHDLMPDFLHLSPAGYKIWSDELANVIK